MDDLIQKTVITPSEFLNIFLSARNLASPSGKPLYLYHITPAEFGEMKKVIGENFLDSTMHQEVNLAWCAVFALFSSEWFRREYDNSWSWNPIFESLGLSSEDLSNKIGNIIKKGLINYWSRPLFNFIESNHNSYLGSVFKEGGLPSKLLTQEGSDYQAVFKNIIKQYSYYKNFDDILRMQLIRNYVKPLPQVFSHEESICLIADMANQLIKLVDEFNLSDDNNPTQVLDRKYPQWRESFALPLEDETATQFLNQLLITSSQSQTINSNDIISLSCQHVYDSNLQTFYTELFIPSNLELTLDDIFDIRPRVELSIFEQENEIALIGTALFQSRPKMGESSILSVQNYTKAVKRIDFSKELSLVVKIRDQVLHRYYLPQSAVEINQVPVGFTYSDNGIYRYQGQASFKTKESTIILSVPADYKFLDKDVIVDTLGKLNDNQMYQVKGTVCLTDGDNHYKIQCSNFHGFSEAVELKGTIAPWDTTPSLAFIGLPKAKYIERGLQSRNYELKIYVGKDLLEQLENTAKFGIKYLTIKNSENEVLLKRKVCIFPDNFNLKIAAGNSANIAVLKIFGKQVDTRFTSEFENLQYSCIKIEEEGLQGREYTIKSSEFPPASFNVSFMLSFFDESRVTINLPFPRLGAFFYDGKNKQINGLTKLTLNNLLGSTLYLYNNEGSAFNRFKLSFKLQIDGIKGMYAPEYHWSYVVNQEPVKIHMHNYRNELEELLSLPTNIDASVCIQVSGPSLPNNLTYQISHYKTVFSENDHGLFQLKGLSLAEQQSVNPAVMVLSQPEQHLMDLEPVLTEGVETGQYRLPRLPASEPCLIIPKVNDEIQFRPYFVGSKNSLDESYFHTLHGAIRAYHPTKNPLCIANYLTTMVENLDDSGWIYLENLYQNYQHLPLVTFHVWKEMANNSECLTIAIWRLEFDLEICKRFEREFGIVWELIPIKTWKNAIRKNTQYLMDSNISEAMAVKQIKKHYRKFYFKTTEFSWLTPLLSDQLEEYYFSDNLSLVPKRTLKASIETWLQELIRTDIEWPRYFENELRKWYDNFCKDNETFPIKPTINNPVQTCVITLPIYLARKNLGKVENIFPSNSPNFSNFYIRKIIQADKRWFNSIFVTSLIYSL